MCPISIKFWGFLNVTYELKNLMFSFSWNISSTKYHFNIPPSMILFNFSLYEELNLLVPKYSLKKNLTIRA